MRATTTRLPPSPHPRATGGCRPRRAKGEAISMQAESQTQRLTPQAPKGGKRGMVVIGAVILAGAGLYAAGTLPRVRRQAVLAADVKQVRTAIPAVTVVTPSLVSAGGL